MNVEGNDVLNDISGLSSVTFIDNHFEVVNNPMLATSQAESIADSIATIGGEIRIYGNADE